MPSQLSDTINKINDIYKKYDTYSKEEILALSAKDRMAELSEKYDNQFDSYHKKILKTTATDRDLIRSMETLVSLSNSLEVLVNTLINHIDFYQNNFFND